MMPFRSQSSLISFWNRLSGPALLVTDSHGVGYRIAEEPRPQAEKS